MGIDDIRAAAARLQGRIHRTPVITVHSFDERCGHTVFFKCENLTGVLLVSDEDIAAAVRFLLLRGKLLVEPTGAVPAAALLAGKLPMPKGSRVGVVLSGGNIDPALLAEILSADG